MRAALGAKEARSFRARLQHHAFTNPKAAAWFAVFQSVPKTRLDRVTRVLSQEIVRAYNRGLGYARGSK